MKLISTLIIIGAAVGIFFVFGRPELDTISALREEQSEIEQSLAELQELARLRDDLLSKYNAVNPVDIERLDKIVPAAIDSGLLIAELESFAQEFNLVLKNVSITDEKTLAQTKQRGTVARPESAEQPFKKLPLSLSVSGTYNSFRNFLSRLEVNTRIVDIKEVNFQSAEKDFFDFQIEANTYWIGDIIKASETTGVNNQ